MRYSTTRRHGAGRSLDFGLYFNGFWFVGHGSRVRSSRCFGGFLPLFPALAPAAPQAFVIPFYFHLDVHNGTLLHEVVAGAAADSSTHWIVLSI